MSRLMIAGLAVAGAGLFAMSAPTSTGPLVQHRAVQLVDTTVIPEVDWTDFFTNVSANLSTLQAEGATSSAELSTALGNLTGAFDTQINTALSGFETGINNALFGGWYGSDDGYVFGLFGGEPVLGGPTPGITGSLIEKLSDDLQNVSGTNGAAQLYSDFNNYSLELLDHTARPLLGPLLDEGSTSSPIYSIPAELSQIQTNLINEFGTYTELKGFTETLLSPEISGFFALSTDLDNISAAMTAGDSATAMTDLDNVGSDVLNAVVNGYDAGTNPVDGLENLFPGLLTTGDSGGFLGELYTSWTEQFVTALGSLGAESGASVAADSVSTALPDLFTGLF